MAAGNLRQGNPQSKKCRHCGVSRITVRKTLFCRICDAGMFDGVTIKPTWSKP